MSDAVSGLTHACGVFGCVATGPWPTQLDIANVICLGLVGLQHRGQESAGIVTCDGQDAYTIHQHKGMGLVSQIFDEERLAKLKGNLGIGHTRYSTAGGSELTNCQPFVVETLHGRIALAHNGELVNSNPLKQTLLQRGVSFTTNTDSELMTKLLALTPPTCENDGPDWLGRIKQLMTYTATAYALVLMHKDELYAVRDPYGNRPLCIGKVVAGGDDKPSEEDVEGYVVSSESCSFQSIGAQYYRELLPGEIVRITQHGVESLAVVPTHQGAPTAFCIFEYVYFARADSWFEGQNVYTVRQRLGEQLGREAPVAADLVSTVPESATPAAVGFSKVTGIPYVEVLCKNRYVGRTFIQPSTRLRQLGVTKKFGALSDNFRGKRVVLVDDSIVRGNTMGPIVALLRRSGAKEVHIRIASPPLRHPCYMGINIPTRDELIANRLANTDAALARHLGADSVQYLSVAGLTGAVQQGVNRRLEMGIDKMEGEDENEDEKGQGESASSKTKRGHCVACLTGQYPVSLQW